MLIIRAAQLDAFRARLMPALIERTVRHVRMHCAAAVEWLDTDLHAAVARALTRARGHGLIWKSSLKSFAALALEISPNFDDRLGAELVPPGDGGGRGRIALIYQLQKAT
jgi:hypothetical protein